MKLTSLLVVCCTIQAFPLWFEPNQGQAHPSVQFLAHSPGGYVYFGRNRMATHDVRMELRGARANAQADLEEPLGGITNYFIGRDEKDWHTGIPQYGRIRYKDVYAGIDLVYYGNDRNIEYDFILKPGADPNQIKLAYNKPVKLDTNGDLVVGDTRQKRPRVSQNGVEIQCDYLINSHGEIQLALGRYDSTATLTVDPKIEYSTFLGGPASDSGESIKVDASGAAYVTGTVKSPPTPGLNPFQQTSGLSQDIFVVKFAPDGSHLLYYDLLGGALDDYGNGLVLNSSNEAWIVGNTSSQDYPIKNALQNEYGGGFNDGVISKISVDGRSLLFSTYLGGIGTDYGYGIAIDSGNNIYVGLQTNSILPIKNALQPARSGGVDAYVAKLNSSGQLAYATYLGGSGFDALQGVATDGSGSVYVSGFTSSDDFPLRNPYQSRRPHEGGGFADCFVTKLSPDGSALVYSTFVGSVGCYRIAVDASGSAYVEGYGAPPGLPPMNGFQTTFAGGDNDKVVFRLSASGSELVFAALLGGSGAEYGTGDLVVAPDGSVYVAGHTTSKDFPVQNSLQPFTAGGGLFSGNAFVSRLSADGKKLLFSTFLGGSATDWAEGIALDAKGAIYVTGSTSSDDYPVVNAFQKIRGGLQDVIITKITPDPVAQSLLNVSPGALPFRYVIGGPSPAPQLAAVTSANAASFNPAPSSPWIEVSATARTTPATLSVLVDPTALNAGSYTGSIELDPTTSIQVNLAVFNAAPQVTSISPSVIPVGSVETVLTISGSGFVDGSTVQYAGSSVTLASAFVDPTTLKFSLPAGAFAQPGTLSIVVANPQSAPSNAVTLTIGTPVPQFTAASVVNAASFIGGPVAPGEIVTIFGANLTDKVNFDNVPATLVYASASQVSVTVPYSITRPTTMVQVGSSAPVKLDVAPSAPGIFAAVPAAEDVLVLYATGCGQLTTDELPRCALPVTATVNEQPATVLYAGIAPGLVQGANQINLQLPHGLASGPLTIVLTAGDSSSKPFSLTVP